MKNPPELLQAELTEGERLLWWGQPLPPPGETTPSKTLYGITTYGVIVISPAGFLSSRPYRVFSQPYGSPFLGEPSLYLCSDSSGTITFSATPELPRVWGDENGSARDSITPPFTNIANAKAVYKLLLDARQKYLDSDSSPAVPAQVSPETASESDASSWAISDFTRPGAGEISRAVPSNWEERARIFPWRKGIVAALLLSFLVGGSLLLSGSFGDYEPFNSTWSETMAALALSAMVAMVVVLWAKPRIGWGKFALLLAVVWICVPLVAGLLVPFPTGDSAAGGLAEATSKTSADNGVDGASASATATAMEAKARLTFGPRNSELAPHPGAIAAYTTGVTHRDFVVETRFHNPRDAREGGWDYGFIFRWTPQDDAYMLTLRHDRSWALDLIAGASGGGKRRPVASGKAGNLDTSGSGSNRVRLAAEGESGLLTLNGQHIAQLDLSEVVDAGSVVLVANTQRYPKMPTTSTKYDGLTIRSLLGSVTASSNASAGQLDAPPFPTRSVEKPLLTFGPEDGSIEHPSGSKLGLRSLDLTHRDFAVESRFHNPWDLRQGNWDFGLLFRGTTEGKYELSVDSTGSWFLVMVSLVRDRFQRETVSTGKVANLDTSANGSNHIKVVVKKDTGTLAINGQYVAPLDVSQISTSGWVGLVIGFWEDRKKPGKSTRYEGFTVWSLD